MSRSHNNNGKREYDRVLEDGRRRWATRDQQRADPVPSSCRCMAITALNPCPYCGGERIEGND